MIYILYKFYRTLITFLFYTYIYNSCGKSRIVKCYKQLVLYLRHILFYFKCFVNIVVRLLKCMFKTLFWGSLIVIVQLWLAIFFNFN